METSNLLSLVSNYGFPIACCVAMFGYITLSEKRHKEEREETARLHKEERHEIEKRHQQEIEKMNEVLERTRQTVENNTSIMHKFTTIIKTLIDTRQIGE